MPSGPCSSWHHEFLGVENTMTYERHRKSPYLVFLTYRQEILILAEESHKWSPERIATLASECIARPGTYYHHIQNYAPALPQISSDRPANEHVREYKTCSCYYWTAPAMTSRKTKLLGCATGGAAHKFHLVRYVASNCAERNTPRFTSHTTATTQRGFFS